MLKAGIQERLDPGISKYLIVVMVEMRIHSEYPLENGLDCSLEFASFLIGKVDAFCGWKDRFIIQQSLALLQR